MTEASSQDPTEVVVGIDLGTTNSLVALAGAEGARILREGEERVFVPSVVSFPEEGRPIVGKTAVMRSKTHPEQTVHSVKRLMGRKLADLGERAALLPYPIEEVEDGERRLVRVKVGDKLHSPEEISGMILRNLKERAERALGHEVRKAVVTVPAYFDDSQRQATRDAGRIAGLEVLRIVNEPTAAALAYGLGGKRDENHTVVVYDLGGGTFDVSILKIQDGVFRVLATRGDTYLGGDDFDIALIRCVKESIAEQIGFDVTEDKRLLSRLRHSAEATKKRLTSDPVAALRIEDEERGKTYEFDVSRDAFESIITPLVERTMDECRAALKDAGLAASEIDEVVCVGGSTRVPLVRQKLAEAFGREPLVDLDPDETVALGAAVQADILTGREENLLLLDVIPLSLGMETVGGAVSKMIMRNETVPCLKTDRFTTFKDNQTGIDIHVLQGERELVEQCKSLAKFQLKGIPPMPAGLAKVDVTFMVDADGILTVMAEEELSGVEAKIEVVPVHGMTEDEVDTVVADSIEHALEDVRAHRLIDLRNESETVLRATKRTIRDVKDVVKVEEIAAVEAKAEQLEALIKTDKVEDIARTLDELNKLTEPLAEIILDRITTATVAGKKLSEFPD